MVMKNKMNSQNVITSEEEQALKPYLLSDDKGLTVKVLAFGGIISSICLKGKELSLGYDDLSLYLDDPFYLGATVGRYANRINQGEFYLGDQKYTVSNKPGEHCLHGGEKGFNKQIWQVIYHHKDELKLYLHSPDGSQGFPGNLDVWQTISLSDNQIKIAFQALSDKDTVVNLTNHCYFNLNGDENLIDNHYLQLFSNHYLPTDEEGIPTGKIEPTLGTSFNFNESNQLNQVLASDDEQIQLANGIDHCFTLGNTDKPCGNKEQSVKEKIDNQLVAKLTSPQSNIMLSLFTSLPGVQVYTGNYLTTPFKKNQGVCLEAQFWPDSPNNNDFPSTKLNANEKLNHEIIYAFND